MKGDIKRGVREILEIITVKYSDSHINDIMQSANNVLFDSRLELALTHYKIGHNCRIGDNLGYDVNWVADYMINRYPNNYKRKIET